MKKLVAAICLLSVFLLSGCIVVGKHNHPDRHHQDDNRWHETHRSHDRWR
ncbi:hypothetical protein HC231_12450 [Brenneria izadpanahii]|uniref:Lipoprotein n=1 Tax=Brenneria izadpanahii TaxID=2722756 RepID=A0ABX7UPL5_9GAMM|nr:hypothetical protein [Brenneria izadpanahii]QTF06482.1 hypothetical protein HC231_12450 [Brenneria izadpanahii]